MNAPRRDEVQDDAPLGALLPPPPQAHATQTFPTYTLAQSLPGKDRAAWTAMSVIELVSVQTLAVIIAISTADPAMPTIARTVRVLVAVLFGGLGWAVATVLLRLAAATPPTVQVTGEQLVIHNTALFGHPLSVPRSLISRITIATADDELVGATRQSLPLVTGAFFSDPPPNVAVYFHYPVALHAVRRGFSTFELTSTWRGPVRNQYAAGVLLTLNEPNVLRSLLSTWQVVGPPPDAREIPVATQAGWRERARRQLLVIGVIFLFSSCIAAVSLSGGI